MDNEKLDVDVKCELNRIINDLNNPPDFEAFLSALACPYCYGRYFHLFVADTKTGRDELYVCQDCHSAWVKLVNLETGAHQIINLEDTCPGKSPKSK